MVDDLASFGPRVVIKDGRIVARDGAYLPTAAAPRIGGENTVHLAGLDESAFRLDVPEGPASVIGIVPDQIVTRHLRREARGDVALIASIERLGRYRCPRCGSPLHPVEALPRIRSTPHELRRRTLMPTGFPTS